MTVTVTEQDALSERLARVVREARESGRMSAAALATRSGVSRAMIGKIERGDVQPTASLLARLSGALGLTLSELIARAEGEERRVVRATEQPTWTDPETGYTRRAVSPSPGGALELIEIVLPAGAEVAVPAESYAFIHQQIWVLDGHLRFIEGDQVHELGAGDCLQLGAPQPCTFVNATTRPCRYLVALTKSR